MSPAINRLEIIHAVLSIRGTDRWGAFPDIDRARERYHFSSVDSLLGCGLNDVISDHRLVKIPVQHTTL